MRILQVIPYFPPAYFFGGPVRGTYLTSKELVKKGHEVTVYTTDAINLTTRLNETSPKIVDGINVHYFPNITMKHIKWLKFFVTPEMITETRNNIKKFDIIHLREYTTFQNIVIHHYAVKNNIPYILQAHGSILYYVGDKQKLKQIFDIFFGDKILHDASKAIVLNQIEAEQHMQRGMSKEKIEIIDE